MTRLCYLNVDLDAKYVVNVKTHARTHVLPRTGFITCLIWLCERASFLGFIAFHFGLNSSLYWVDATLRFQGEESRRRHIRGPL